MKNILFFLLVITTSISAQSVAKLDTGTIKGADYKIIFPEKWEKKLVMFAHGYEFMGAPSQSKRTDLAQRMKPFLDRGFAVAASDYAYQGFAMPQGVDDTAQAILANR